MPARPNPFLLAGLLGALALCWILLTPPGAAPDEPSHLYRAGELAEGRFGGWLATEDLPRVVTYRLPPEYAVPEPACYAQQPEIPVDCAVGTEARPSEPDGLVLVGTTAHEYPIWGHLVPAVGTVLPGDGGIWAARIVGAAVCVALLAGAAAVVVQRSALAFAGVIAALTPMAWATIATVNPSAFATAGAVAVWVGLVSRRPGWLLAAGWAALVLPRRDGLTWACLILAAVVIVDGREVLTDAWRERRRLAGPLTLVGVTTVCTLVWDLTNAVRIARLGALAPLVVLIAYGIRAGWDALAGRRGARGTYAAALVAAGAATIGVVLVRRPGGWDPGLTRDVIGETRRHLTEAIGVLGWLDTPLPRWATAGWAIVIAALAGLAVRARAWRALTLAAATLTVAVVTMWVFELQQGSDYGRYWQGRYSLPLLVGVPIALTVPRSVPDSVAGHVRDSRSGPATESRGAWMTGGAALLLLNVAAWAAARRWAVGINGTHRPWNWGADLFAVHPLPILIAHGAVSAALVWVLLRNADGRRRKAPVSTTIPSRS